MIEHNTSQQSIKRDGGTGLISEQGESKMNSSTVTVGFFSKINCNILKSGITPFFDQYYLCECDPERRNAICAECFKICHSGHGHKEIKKFLCAKVCMCGYKGHQPMDEKDDQVQHYSKECLFGSLGLKYFYVDKTVQNSHICIFCKNLCFKNAKTLNRIKNNGNYSDKMNNLNINETVNCNCTNHNHNDIRILFRKLRGLTKKKNFIDKYDFEGLSLVHVINLLIRDNVCFTNLFYSFSFHLNEIIRKIKEESFYAMEDYKFVNNFHLTCEILSSFAEKNMNIYSTYHYMPGEINPSIYSYKTNTHSAGAGGDNISNNLLNLYAIKLRPLCYYRDEIGNILTTSKYFQIMLLKFDFKSRNIWQLKYNLTNIFFTFNIRKIFLPTINYKIRDMLLLSPLQRLIIVSTNKKKIENINEKNSGILDMTINLLIKLEKANERHNEVFCIYNILYKICQYYAKFGFFTYTQVTHFCSVNKKLLLMITENLAEDKKSKEKKNLIFKVLSPMMKTLLYLCYHFNDQMLMSYLNKERNINSINFFHMKNEICKLTMSNVIYTLSIIQELVPEILMDNSKNDMEDSASQEEIQKRKGKMRTSLIKFQVNMHYHEDANMKRCIRNATFAAHSIIRIILDLPDNYQSTMTRLVNSNGELLFNYLTENSQNSKDTILISKFRKINDDLEESYTFCFDTYDEFYENLIHSFNQNLDILVTLINEVKASDANNNEINRKILMEEKNKKILREETININNENSVLDNNNTNNNKRIFNILINFSTLMQTIFKGLHIFFYFYVCKKSNKDKNKNQKEATSEANNNNNKDYFIVEQNIFNKVLEICLYYIENDINNCFIFLTSDILNIVQLLNSVQLYDFLTVIEKCLIKIRDSSEEVTSNTYLIRLLKICVSKSLYNLELTYKILKLISITLQLNLGNEINTLKKLKKLFIWYYDIFKESQIDLHSLLIEKELSGLTSTKNIQNGIKTIPVEVNMKKKELESEESEIEKFSAGHSFLIYNKEFAKKNKNKNVQERFFNLRNKITYKILWIINTLFESNTTFDEKTFLECLLSKNEIKLIAKDLTLDIGIRTELLIFYRIVYLDTVLLKNNISFYMSLLINEPIMQKTEAIAENQKLLRFYQNLVMNDQNKIMENITEDSDVIKFELLNYKGIIESLAKNNNIKKTRNYIEQGIIKSLLIYISKFSGIVFNCSGYDYLRYYELLYHFLFLKKYILEHPNIFNKGDEEENDDETEKSDTFLRLNNNTNVNKVYRNPFRNKLNSLCKHRKKIIICDFDANELKNVKSDIEKLIKLNFEVLNFSLMRNIFESSFYGFIQKERLNKGMKEVFEKADQVYDEKGLEKKKKYLQKFGLYSTYFQQDIFEIIIHYINGKTQLEDSSFIKMLSKDNIFYNCKWLVLLIKNILFFMMNTKFENTYKEMCLWELFRLLEYNTREAQKACLELMEKKDNPVNFEYFLQNITLHIMNVLISELNPGSRNIRYNYYMTLMIIKILKYFCEEHNQNFQRIFFVKEDDGIILHYNPKQYYQKEEEENIIYFDENEDFKNSLITESDNIEEENKENGNNLQKNYFSIFENPSTKPVPDIECEDLHEITRSEDKNNEEQKSKASVFEFMLSILGKIILLSGWNNSKNLANLDDYLYDLYFVILEFLIETIQGTKAENLETVFKKDSNGKNLFGTFLNDIHKLIHEDNEEELSYQVRKDMMDFLMTFLEESATPPIGIIEISTVILPINILENIVNTMNKLYESIKDEKKEDDNDNYNNIDDSNALKGDNLLKNKLENPSQINLTLKKKNDNLINDIDDYSLYQNKNNFTPLKNNLSLNEQSSPLFLSNSHMNNQNQNNSNNQNSSEENQDLNKKLNNSFTPKMKKFFNDKYFNDPEFAEDIRFGLANRMYQFFKFFGTADEYKNPAVYKFYEKMSWFSERNIIKNYYSSRRNQNLTLSDDNINNLNMGDKRKEKSATITDPSFYDNYLCVSFFESITRMVFVNKPGIEKPIRVLFTINPVVSLLSNVSKNDFLENVDRSDRYSKLFSLMESCDYFFEELSYKQNQAKNNFIAKFIIDLDFYWLEVFSFVVDFIINIILISTVEGEGERLYGDSNMAQIVDILGLFNFIFNFLVILIWILIKFPLYYLTESHKYLKKKIKEKEEKNEDDEEINLNLFDKIYVIYFILIKKSTLTGFLWNLAFTCAGVFSKIHFLYIVQILGITNLSQTLRNLILSLTIKLNQLSAVFYCILVFNLLFGNIAFFKFSRDFIREVDSSVPHSYSSEFNFLNDVVGSPYIESAHVENECGTLLYCFVTHLSYGMRFDGGIADRMEKASYTYEKGYYVARFFYEELYFFILVILMLNMMYGIIIDAFSELRNKEKKINRDRKEVCFICGIDKETCEKKGEKLDEHLTNVHNLWIYVEYMIGLRFVDIQDANAINSYVIESLEKKELVWFPYDETAMAGDENKGKDEN